jgi:transcriptional regulator with XRE-family HTH domain
MAKRYALLNRIREIRLMHDLTLKDLATSSELSESEISDVENGYKQPTHPTMLKICKGLGLKFDDIFETNPDNLKITQ